MNRPPRPPAPAPPVEPPPLSPGPNRRDPRPLSGLRGPLNPRPSPGRTPGPSALAPRRAEPGLKDVAAGWVASHPAAALGLSAATGAFVGWLLKRR